jgi:class 3 adenylate cyclase
MLLSCAARSCATAIASGASGPIARRWGSARGWRPITALPAGTVTLLFSDIEGSTRLLERLGQRYDGVRDEHGRIVRGAIAAHGGCEVRTEGDAFFVAFARAGDAVRAAVAAQRGLARFARSEGWHGSSGHRGWRCGSGSAHR